MLYIDQVAIFYHPFFGFMWSYEEIASQVTQIHVEFFKSGDLRALGMMPDYLKTKNY